MTDPVSITVGAIGIAGVGGQAVKAARDFRASYRDAGKEIRHAKSQFETLQSTLESTYFKSHRKSSTAQSSFEAIGNNFPGDLRSDSRKAKLRWAATTKGKVAEFLGQLKETEISTILTLILDQSTSFDEVRASLSRIEEELVVMKQRDLEQGKDKGFFAGTSLRSAQQSNPTPDTLVQDWDTRIHKYLGITAGMIVYKSDGKIKYKVFFRWPIFRSKVLNGRIESSWPSWPSLSICPLLRIQNIVSNNSSAIEACLQDDVPVLRSIFLAGEAHPNDTTADNLTLLYFTVREKKVNATRLLLEIGADPDLTYGRWETSPLNTAFYTGNVDGVRLLLDRNADIEYTNRRKWTSARYLYDSEGINPHSLELLDVCAGLGFDGWNSQDQVGWTLFHRASAFGQGSDIKKLLNLGADSNILTYTLLWLPIFCAVTFGNESTFDILVDLIPLRSLPNLKDSRGWTLLHIAAENGSEVMMTRLLQRSLDPFAKSDKSTLGVPEGLPFEELTSGDIARFCNHQEAYEQALKNAGYSAIGPDDPNELLLQEPG